MAHAKGLRDRRVMTRYAGRNAILPPLNGFAALFASAVGGLVFIEYVFSYPGAGLHAAAGGARQRLPARAGAAGRPLGLRDRREPRHGHPQPRPRPAGADRADVAARPDTSTLEPRRAAAGARSAAGSASPAGSCCCCATRSRASGSSMVALRRGRRADRAADLGRRPERLQPARRAPGAVVAPPVRHDRPGQRHLLAGRARRPPLAAARRRRRARSRPPSPRSSASRAAYVGGIVDEVVNFLTNVFLVIPAIPLLDRRLRLPEDAAGWATMILVLALMLWAFEARILRGQALSLKNRDFVARGEGGRRVDVADRLRRADAEHDQPHRGGVRARLLHRAAHRRRPRVPRPRRHDDDELGRDALLGADELDRAAGRVVAVLLPGRRARVHRARARARSSPGIDEVSNPRLRSDEARSGGGCSRRSFGGRAVARPEESA